MLTVNAQEIDSAGLELVRELGDPRERSSELSQFLDSLHKTVPSFENKAAFVALEFINSNDVSVLADALICMLVLGIKIGRKQAVAELTQASLDS